MKLSKLLLLTLGVAVTLSFFAIFPDRLCFSGGDGYTFYVGTSSADCKIIDVDGGAAFKRLTLSGVCGEATVFNNFDLDEFLHEYGAEVVAVETLSDSVNYYCTANLPYSVKLYGTRVNLHISVRGDRAKVGSPIIFGGY